MACVTSSLIAPEETGAWRSLVDVAKVDYGQTNWRRELIEASALKLVRA